MSPSRSARGLLLAAGMALGAATWMQQASAVALGEHRITSTRASTKGTVTAVDAAARTLTVKSPRGEATYRVDPKVKDLEALKPGDAVRVDYVTRLGLTLRRSRNPPAEGAAPSATPAASDRVIAKDTTIVTHVLGVDRSRSTIKLKGPQGFVGDYEVADKADLSGIRVGDEVVIVLYELAAVGVAPAKR
jgi:Cu/Ag efflux protein CusF